MLYNLFPVAYREHEMAVHPKRRSILATGCSRQSLQGNPVSQQELPPGDICGTETFLAGVQHFSWWHFCANFRSYFLLPLVHISREIWKGWNAIGSDMDVSKLFEASLTLILHMNQTIDSDSLAPGQDMNRYLMIFWWTFFTKCTAKFTAYVLEFLYRIL